MKQVFFLCTLIISSSSFALSVQSNQRLDSSEFGLMLEKAKVATFYSAAYSNGWDELQLAKSYTDSAEALFLKFDNSDSSIMQLKNVIRDLHEEHAVSEAIAVENVNYKYPAFSLMSGYRDDFIVKDDAEELLLESLLEKVLSQNDPLNKGKISENIDFLVFQTLPYSQTLFLVASDYLATKTGHYVIRYHEFAEILGEEGLQRFKVDELSQDDWDKIFEFYGIDKILNLKVVDQGSIIPGLFDKGIFINSVEKGYPPEYIGYSEGFKVDKVSSWNNAVILLVINFGLTVVGLFLMMSLKFTRKKGRGFRFGKYNVVLFINWDTFKETAIIATVSLASAIGVQYLGNQLAPDINAFYQESSVRVWVLFQSVVPFLASVLFTYILMFKLPNIIVNNANGYARILFGSWMAQLAVLSYYEYHAELFPDSFWLYMDFIPLIGLIFLSTLLGSVLNKIFKKEKVSVLGYVLLVLGFVFALLSFWLELRELFLIAAATYFLLAVISVCMLYNPKRIGRKTTSIDNSTLKSESGLSNPVKWYTEGLNVRELREELMLFLASEDISNRMLVLRGKSGSGKTRFLKECVGSIQAKKRNIRWFQGDCNQVLEGTSPLYEPFYEAFSLNGEFIEDDKPKHERCLPQGFFTDRSQLSKVFGKVVSHAESFASVDLANLLSVEDETSRSVDEIVSELLDSLITRYVEDEHSKVVLAIDDFQWIDQASYELLKRFFEKVKERSKYSKYFKFVITIASDQDSEDQPSIEKLHNIIQSGERRVTNSINTHDLEVINGASFVDRIISETEFEIEKSRSTKFRFGPLLKGYLQYVISNSDSQFVPGDFLGYLDALEKQGFIHFDGEVIRLLKEPSEDEIGLQDSRKSVLESDFNELPFEKRSLLESAAIVGYKFDAELLARIWNKDLIIVLAELELLEGSFIQDLSQQDNIYSFVSKTMYRVVLECANRKKDDSESRQLIIEYQKRIIKTIIEDNKGGYVEGLDLDMLLSASERCFKYSHVQYINDNAVVIVLNASNKLAMKGKRDQCISYLKRLYERYSDFTSMELLLIAKTLTELTKSNRLTDDFEFTKGEGDDVAFIDHVFVKSRQNAEVGVHYEKDSFSLIALLLQGGVMQFVRNLSKVDKDASILNLDGLIDSTDSSHQYADRLIARYNLIVGLMSNSQISNEKALSRLTFYNHIATNGDYHVLPNLFKNAISLDYVGLAGEIAREIYFKSDYDKIKRLRYLFASLDLLTGADVSVDLIEEYVVDKEAVERSIEKIIKAKNLSSKEAQDFNFLLSRFREHFFNLKDFNYVLVLCDIAMELSKRLNDAMGITLSYSYSGAALYQLERYQESHKIYESYFEQVIRSSRKIDDFLYPLEGILRNAKKLDNHTLYNRAKGDLYEHLIILEKSAIEKKLEHSLFDNNSSFSHLLNDVPEPKGEAVSYIEEDEDNVSLDIIRILVSMAAADGVIDQNEKYDLKEAGIAISHSLNLSKSDVIGKVGTELKAAIGRSIEETEALYLHSCENVKVKKSKGYLESVLLLCSDIAMADKNLDKMEKRLLDLSRLLLINE